MAVAGVFMGSRVALLPPAEPARDASGLITVTSAEQARPFMHPVHPAAVRAAADSPLRRRPAADRGVELRGSRPGWQRAVGCIHTRPVAPRTPSHAAVPERLWTPTAVESVHVAELLDWRRRADAAEPGSGLVALLEDRPDVLAGRRSTLDDTAAGVFSHAAAVLDGIVARRRQLAAMAADEVRDLALLIAEYPGVDQFLPAEVAIALGIPEVEAQNLLDRAHRMVTALPQTLAALGSGVITPEAAEAVVNATATADPTVAGRVEAAVVPTAAGRTYRQVFAACSYRLAKWDAPAMRRRQRQAVADRRMTRRALSDGMARLSATGTAEQIAAVWEALTLLADAAATPDDLRDTGNRRVDALVDVCIDAVDRIVNGDLPSSAGPVFGGGGSVSGGSGPVFGGGGSVSGDGGPVSGGSGGSGVDIRTGSTGQRPRRARRRTPRPSVQVVMPLSSLLGGDDPALLAGHGPIPADLARRIAADADLRRLICDPLSGQVIDFGRTLYPPPQDLARLVKTRDRICCFPGCEQPAGLSDLDHVIPAKPDPATGKPTHGTTCYCNLCALCRHHHLLKDGIGGFTLTRSADGTYTWITVLGRVVTRGPTDTLGAGDHTLNGQPTLRQAGCDVDEAPAGSVTPEATRQADHPTASAPTSSRTDQVGENTCFPWPLADGIAEREDRDLERGDSSPEREEGGPEREDGGLERDDRSPEHENRSFEQSVWDRDRARYRALSDHDRPATPGGRQHVAGDTGAGPAPVMPPPPTWADDLPADPPF